MDLQLPQFLGIGAQKSATSWLYKMLEYHPDLYLSQKKEIHFFDLNYMNGLEWYSNHFLFSGDKIRGEITPSYAILDQDTIRFIKEIMPEVRLLFILRDPIDRAWSHALMEFTVVQGRPYEEVSEADLLGHIKSEGSILRGDYGRCLDNWLSVFPREQIFIGYYEEVVGGPADLIEKTLRHIGVDPKKYKWDETPLDVVVHQGNKQEIPPQIMEELVKIYTPIISDLEKKYPSEYSNLWKVKHTF